MKNVIPLTISFSYRHQNSLWTWREFQFSCHRFVHGTIRMDTVKEMINEVVIAKASFLNGVFSKIVEDLRFNGVLSSFKYFLFLIAVVCFPFFNVFLLSRFVVLFIILWCCSGSVMDFLSEKRKCTIDGARNFDSGVAIVNQQTTIRCTWKKAQKN